MHKGFNNNKKKRERFHTYYYIPVNRKVNLVVYTYFYLGLDLTKNLKPFYLGLHLTFQK